MTASRSRGRELTRIIGDLSTAIGLLERDVPALDLAAPRLVEALGRLNALRAREAGIAPPEGGK
jgi:hypothetical protein